MKVARDGHNSRQVGGIQEASRELGVSLPSQVLVLLLPPCIERRKIPSFYRLNYRLFENLGILVDRRHMHIITENFISARIVLLVFVQNYLRASVNC